MAQSDNSRPVSGYDVRPEVLPDVATEDPSVNGRYELPEEAADVEPDSGHGSAVRRGLMGGAVVAAGSLVAAWIWRRRQPRSRVDRLRAAMGRTARATAKQARSATGTAGKAAVKAAGKTRDRVLR